MSLQLKLNLLITCLLLVVFGGSTFFVLKNARKDVRAEISATENLAFHLIDAEMLHYPSDFDWVNNSELTAVFSLQSLDSIRHLKIEFYDINGKLRKTNRKNEQQLEVNMPPAWFAEVMGLAGLRMHKQARKIILNRLYVGELIVTPDPSYEIAVVWNNTVGMLAMMAIFFFIINVLVYLAVKYTFRPVDRIVDALTKMQYGHFSRLPDFRQIELHEIGRNFNAMADTLQKCTHNNHRLTQQIIRLQEDERKSLARDIHDEIGQYLTAIHMDASAILYGRKLSAAKESALAISKVTRQMMDVVHQILQRLRPRILGEFGLDVALVELVEHWRQRCENVNIVYDIDKSLGVLDEVLTITAYRVMQECLTNIAKHANAGHVIINVKQDTQFIYLYIEDDGVGFDSTISAQGFGLSGMRERIQGLMGEIIIKSAINQGVKVTVRLRKYELESALA